MLHLLAPHFCPACNGLHKPMPKSAAELRPFFATFLQIAGSGSVPVVTTRTLASGGPGAASVWTGSSGAMATPGHYVGMWTYSPTNTNTGQVVVFLRKAGVQQGLAFTTACQNGTQTSYNGYAEFDVTGSEVIDLFCSSQTGSNGSASTGTFTLIFIPTPNNRR